MENILNEQANTPDTAQEQLNEQPNEQQPNEQVDEQKNETLDAKEDAQTFTQEMVNEIVKTRLEKDRKSFFKRYGVENRDDLDSLIGKSQSYDIMKERYDGIVSENAKLREQLAYVNNNINPERVDDIRAYFKGKELEFNEEALVNELATHPEWLNVKEVNEAPQTTIKSLGVEHSQKIKRETEEEKQKRIFGI